MDVNPDSLSFFSGRMNRDLEALFDMTSDLGTVWTFAIFWIVQGIIVFPSVHSVCLLHHFLEHSLVGDWIESQI